MGWASEGRGKDVTGLDPWDKVTTLCTAGNEEDKYACREVSRHGFEQVDLAFSVRHRVQIVYSVSHVEETNAKNLNWLSNSPGFVVSGKVGSRWSDAGEIPG